MAITFKIREIQLVILKPFMERLWSLWPTQYFPDQRI